MGEYLMPTRDLTEETFNSTVTDNDIMFIEFWASCCGLCRMFALVYENVSEVNSDIVFAKVNTEDHPALAGDFQISSIPTVMAIREGVVLYAEPGALSKKALEDLILAVRHIDMDEVRQSLASEEAGE
jgi:thioredoxin 1